MLFLFFLLWVPAFFYCLHFVSVPAAAALTLLAVAWSIPNYGAALPSWYNLFFATFGVAVLLHYIETRRRGWLFLAGVCGGISCLFKLTGLYFVGGVLLFLLFRERTAPETKAVSHTGASLLPYLSLGRCLCYEVLVFGVLQKVGHPAIYLYFWTPELAIGATILWCEFYSPERRTRRFAFLFRELMPFAVGFAAPLAIFLGRYVLAGSQSRLLEIFTLAARQLDFAAFQPSLLKVIGGVLLNVFFIAAAFLTRGRAAKIAATLLMLGIPVALLLVGQSAMWIEPPGARSGVSFPWLLCLAQPCWFASQTAVPQTPCRRKRFSWFYRSPPLAA